MYMHPPFLFPHQVDPTTPLATQLPTLVPKLTQQLGLLGSIADILPPNTLAWKLSLLQQGNDILEDARVYARVKQRVLVLTSDGDLLIPSGEEGERLQRKLPRAQSKVCVWVCVGGVGGVWDVFGCVWEVGCCGCVGGLYLYCVHINIHIPMHTIPSPHTHPDAPGSRTCPTTRIGR